MPGPILIFDSGVGGLSVVPSLRQYLPGTALVYACDNAMLPYGIRPDAWLVERILAVCQAAVLASSCSVLVVACNTASTLALDALRARLTVPVVGTVPAIKPAATVSHSRHIGLLATSATVARPYTDTLIAAFAADCRVTRVAADPLVKEVERWLAGNEPDQTVVDRVTAPLWQAVDLDTVVLGCTHFPLISECIVAASPRPVRLVDSSEAIARRTLAVADRPSPKAGCDQSLATAPTSSLARAMAAFGFDEPQRLIIG